VHHQRHVREPRRSERLAEQLADARLVRRVHDRQSMQTAKGLDAAGTSCRTISPAASLSSGLTLSPREPIRSGTSNVRERGTSGGGGAPRAVERSCPPSLAEREDVRMALGGVCPWSPSNSLELIHRARARREDAHDRVVERRRRLERGKASGRRAGEQRR
jgi:hypothetical protein